MTDEDFEIFDEMDEIFDKTFGSLEEEDLDLDRVKIEIAGRNLKEEKIEEAREKIEDTIGEGKCVDIEMTFKPKETEEDC